MERFDVALLRRVAIVLSSLPEATADRLLSRLDRDQQHAVRRVYQQLDEVDPLERRRALDGFAHSLHQQHQGAPAANAQGRQPSPAGTEVIFSRVALEQSAQRSPASAATTASQRQRSGTEPMAVDASHSGAPTSESPFAFLADVADDVIAFRIQDEHPQTVAIVLASVAPTQAARLLPKLGVALRADTMRRLAKMEMPMPEVVDELASQLRQKLLPHGFAAGYASASAARSPSAAVPGMSVGKAALQAILAEMNHSGSGTSLATNEHSDVSRYRLADTAQPTIRLHAADLHPDELSPSALAALRRSSSNSQTTADSARSRSFDYPVSSRPADRVDPITDDRSDDHQLDDGVAKSALSADEVRQLLQAASAEALREALASIDGRLAMLALCGLPSSKADAVLATLPRRQAKSIRQQLSQLGHIELRQIEDAKAEVAGILSGQRNRLASPVPSFS